MKPTRGEGLLDHAMPPPDHAWPSGFDRIPPEPWTLAPVEDLARHYDTVERHGWYANLDPTVAALTGHLREGMVLVDYSGGTGILAQRLLRARPATAFGVVLADSSPKFLRLALAKLGSDPRVGFRLLPWMREARRLARLDEALGPALTGRVDAIASTNAIHLYRDLEDTLASWARCLAPGGRVWVQSGNILRDDAPPAVNVEAATASGSSRAASGASERTGAAPWIIDGTVEAVRQAARELVAEGRDPAFARHRDTLRGAARMAAHDTHFRKVFPPPRPLRHYVAALEGAGLMVEEVSRRQVRAEAKEWFAFLAVYHEAILGWVGGVEKVDGAPASPEAVRDRLALLEAALERALGGRDAFEAEWTHLTARKAA